MMRLWPQQDKPPAYVADQHVGLLCVMSSPPSWDGLPSQPFVHRFVKLWQWTPPASHSEPFTLVFASG